MPRRSRLAGSQQLDRTPVLLGALVVGRSRMRDARQIEVVSEIGELDPARDRVRGQALDREVQGIRIGLVARRVLGAHQHLEHVGEAGHLDTALRDAATLAGHDAQARAIAQAKGEVLVFTDVSARLEPGALRALLRPFADPAVGCVSSEDRVEGESGEGAYVRYEMALRQLESEVATLVGVSGSCFAARRDLCTPWPTHLASDFRIALETARRGLRAVAEPGARARFTAIDDAGAEWSRKVRTVQRGIAVLMAHRDLLHPRFGRAALALWGHKLARFTSPFALLGLLGACAAGAGTSQVLAGLLALQLVGWLTAGAALAWPATAGGLRPARLAGFFALVNASMLVAWARYARGQRAVVWTPTRR